MDVTKDELAQALSDWRAANWGELNRCLATAIEIRDTSDEPRDRNEANKTILRMLGALSTRPSDSASPPDTTKGVGRVTKDTVMSQAEISDIEALIKA
jgi:hypothetical protein